MKLFLLGKSPALWEKKDLSGIRESDELDSDESYLRVRSEKSSILDLSGGPDVYFSVWTDQLVYFVMFSGVKGKTQRIGGQMSASLGPERGGIT